MIQIREQAYVYESAVPWIGPLCPGSCRMILFSLLLDILRAKKGIRGYRYVRTSYVDGRAIFAVKPPAFSVTCPIWCSHEVFQQLWSQKTKKRAAEFMADWIATGPSIRHRHAEEVRKDLPSPLRRQIGLLRLPHLNRPTGEH
jgi:hypothetical protein